MLCRLDMQDDLNRRYYWDSNANYGAGGEVSDTTQFVDRFYVFRRTDGKANESTRGCVLDQEIRKP